MKERRMSCGEQDKFPLLQTSSAATQSGRQPGSQAIRQPSHPASQPASRFGRPIFLSGAFSSAIDSFVSVNHMVAGFFRRTMDIVFCPRRAAIQELRATENWERIVRRINRIRRLRKYWAFLGRYLQQYSALR